MINKWDPSVDYSLSDNTPARPLAIRLKCMDCTLNNLNMVRECEVVSCPLWPWRMGYGQPQNLCDPGLNGVVEQ